MANMTNLVEQLYSSDDLKKELMVKLLSDKEFLDSLSDREEAFLNFVRARRLVAEDLYLTVSEGRIWLIDVASGKRYTLLTARYFVEHVEFDRVFVRDTYTKKLHLIVYNGSINLSGVTFSGGFTRKGSHNYLAIELKYNFGQSKGTVRWHHVVRGMVEGEVALFALRGELHGHHKTRDHSVNTKSTLALVTPETHLAIHNLEGSEG